MGFLKGGADSRKRKNVRLMNFFSPWVQGRATPARPARLPVLAHEAGVVNGIRMQRVAARRRVGSAWRRLPLLESAVPYCSEP